jgi:hypothetical protein
MHLTNVGYTEDAELNCMALVFRDSDGDSLEIQRALVFDQQDRDLGMDTYCLVINASATHYGGISGWLISGDILELVLQPGAAQALDPPHLLRIPLTPAEIQLVEERLPALTRN